MFQWKHAISQYKASFIEGTDGLFVQNVPEWLYKASDPMYVLNEIEFIAPYLEKYDLIHNFKAAIDEDEVKMVD
ncbi:hypothetical protein [Pedobacter aquatilis]|uniref:hypothetical protein n=1 Tax=Pedobacter aquatilis TaxID=351343 RepID=UPI00292DEEF0|nr:hypothetical protein [Pedobacter aquatilis]